MDSPQYSNYNPNRGDAYDISFKPYYKWIVLNTYS